MTYDDLACEMASRGFTETGMTSSQFVHAMIATKDDFDLVVGIAMDVQCGFSFGLALELNVTHNCNIGDTQ